MKGIHIPAGRHKALSKKVQGARTALDALRNMGLKTADYPRRLAVLAEFVSEMAAILESDLASLKDARSFRIEEDQLPEPPTPKMRLTLNEHKALGPYFKRVRKNLSAEHSAEKDFDEKNRLKLVQKGFEKVMCRLDDEVDGDTDSVLNAIYYGPEDES